MVPHYWLMKSEPNCFSINDLKNAPKQMSSWDGVRNYQARNFMLKEMQIGDLAFFYHSNANPTGIAGIVEIVSKPYPDHTALDPDNEHYDPRSTVDKPIWYMVDVKFKEQFPHIISLQGLKQYPELASMKVLQRGNRLSITPVTAREWEFILNL